jgi:predicted Holliday junction resolvase-like endonuclease
MIMHVTMDIRITTSMSYKGRSYEKNWSRKHSQESRNKKRAVREVEMKMLRWILGSLREYLTKKEVRRSKQE